MATLSKIQTLCVNFRYVWIYYKSLKKMVHLVQHNIIIDILEAPAFRKHSTWWVYCSALYLAVPGFTWLYPAVPACTWLCLRKCTSPHIPDTYPPLCGTTQWLRGVFCRHCIGFMAGEKARVRRAPCFLLQGLGTTCAIHTFFLHEEDVIDGCTTMVLWVDWVWMDGSATYLIFVIFFST